MSLAIWRGCPSCSCKTMATGLPLVQLQDDGDGAWSAPMALDGVGVELVCEADAAERFYSRVHFGPLPPQDEEGQWGDLLEANFLLLDPAGAAFSRDPQTHDVVLQQPWPAETQPQTMLRLLATQCDVARHWRAGSLAAPHLPAQEQRMASPARPAPDAGQGTSTAFTQLCERFSALAGLPGPAMQSLPSGVSSFMLEARGVQVQVSHVASMPAWVQMHADIGAAYSFHPRAATELAEANAWLLNQDNGAVICRRPITRDYLLRTRLALDARTPAPRLLASIRAQVSAVLSIRENLVAESVGAV
jgi:hypothetical protein